MEAPDVENNSAYKFQALSLPTARSQGSVDAKGPESDPCKSSFVGERLAQGECDRVSDEIIAKGVYLRTSQDNLHGHSIAISKSSLVNAEWDDDSIWQEECSAAEVNTEKIKPFSTSDSQPLQSEIPEHRKPMAKFVNLDSFGSDEVTESFVPDELKFARMKLHKNKPEKTKHALQTTSNEKVELVQGEVPVTHEDRLIKLGIDPSRHKSESPDPWVKIMPGQTADVPSADVTSWKASSKFGQKDCPEAKETYAPKFQQPLCLEGELKKAPAIEENAVLSPMVLNTPGPCEPEDLVEGIIFCANYLGTTQLVSSRNPAKNARMLQAQEAVSRIKAPDGESQPAVEVDLFISTSKVKILNAQTQETMMSHTLRSISYIADIGDVLVIMAKRPALNEEQSQDQEECMMRKDHPKSKSHGIICHILTSADPRLISESIGQCFSVSYLEFLSNNSIEPQNLSQADFNELLDTQEMYHDDLVHYSKQENVKEIWLEKKKGETMGIAIVESGWGSIIPTVILANLQHGSPMERNGRFSIGDQIMAINGTSMVGLPLQTCHSIVRGLRSQTLVKINIVSCPPVVSVLIKRPNLNHQLGFSVQNGIICSLMRGGIAERGGVRVGHRIIDINNQSVVAMPHDKIVQILLTSVGEILMKTMPAAMYKLLTGQEQPVYL